MFTKKLNCNLFKCSSSLSFQFALLFIPSCNALNSYFYICFTLSDGSSHCLNFEKFRDLAPLRFPKLDANVTRKILYCSKIAKCQTCTVPEMIPNRK